MTQPVFVEPSKKTVAPSAAQPMRLQRKCACGGTPGPRGECEACKRKRLALQPKLTINQPGDRYEQEADRVAEQVVSEGRNFGRKKEKELLLMRSAEASPGPDMAPAIVHATLAQNGHSLDPTTRSEMEARFGYDFSDVRIHRDAQAAESAQSVNARAFTVGSHVVFDSGRYAPESLEGRRLLAHELTHVVQQAQGVGAGVQRQDKPEERIDVALVFGDEETAMTEGRSYAPTALRVISCADAKKKLLALGKPLGRVYFVAHGNEEGEITIDSPGGKLRVKLSDCSKELSGLPANIAPTDLDFRACKLGEAPKELEAARKGAGAKRAHAGNCWSLVKALPPLKVGGVDITSEGQLTDENRGQFDSALRQYLNQLKTDDGRAVKNCLSGLAAGETADNNFAKIRRRYFQHKGNLSAVWASPDYNFNWQKGSICVKDMTSTTSPCKIVTAAEPATASPPAEKKGASVDLPSGGNEVAANLTSSREEELAT
jgi:hypothetical protein